MSALNDLPRRIEGALLAYASQIGRRVSNEEFGIVVAKNEDPPRAEPYGNTTVTAWTKGRGRPSLEALIAIAKVRGQHLCELVLGEGAHPSVREEARNPRRIEETVSPSTAEKTTPKRSRRAVGGPKGRN